MEEAQPQFDAAAPAVGGGTIYCIAHANTRIYQGELLENVVEWAVSYD